MASLRHPWLLRAEKAGRWAENFLLSVFLVGLVLLSSTQILMRNVFSFGWSWADGTIRLAVLWLALLGAVAASRDRRHISINLADRFLPARLQRASRTVVDLFAAAISAAMAWFSWIFVRDSREFGDVLLGLPAWLLEIVMPAAFALIAYRYALHCLNDLKGG